MEIRSTSYQTAQTNRLVHDPACELSVHSSRCYIRERDKRTVTTYYGVEEVDGETVVVTDEYDAPEKVPTLTREQVGEKVGYSRLSERIERLSRQQAELDPVAHQRAYNALDNRITTLKGLLA